MLMRLDILLKSSVEPMNGIFVSLRWLFFGFFVCCRFELAAAAAAVVQEEDKVNQQGSQSHRHVNNCNSC